MSSKGTLQTTVNKKGTTSYSVTYLDDKGKSKSLPLPREKCCFDFKEAVQGDSVEFKTNDTGQISECFIEGKEAMSPPPPVPPTRKKENTTQQPKRGGHAQRSRQDSRQALSQPTVSSVLSTAHAPYNFIPYIHEAVLPVMDKEDRQGMLSGVIRCLLEAKSPLLVAGQKREQGKDTGRHFFSVGEKYYIPGSSIKGMVRSLVEILSFSHMRPLNCKALFWRRVKQEEYKAAFPADMIGGYLKKCGADYSFTRVEVKKDIAGTGNDAGYIKVSTGHFKGSCDYKFALPTEKEKDTALPVDNAVVNNFFEQMTKSQIACTVEQYKEKLKGITEKKDLSAIYHLCQEETGLPVFCIIGKAGNVSEMGLCRYFRRKYAHTPADVHAHHDAPDFASELFGTVHGQALKGRVAFETALVEGAEDTTTDYTVVLGEPHPTCLPHYVDQSKDHTQSKAQDTKDDSQSEVQDTKSNSPKRLKNYDDPLTNLRLRGRKWYWHHDVDTRALGADSSVGGRSNADVTSTLFPLASGAKANITLRFERLSRVELGALLEALQLPKGHAHKLGMGKPLGFGSVRLEVTAVEAEDPRQKYASLAQRLTGKGGKSLSQEEREQLQADFRADVLRRVKAQYPAWAKIEKYDDLPPIEALRLMMDFEQRPPVNAVKYMALKDFSKYAVLPKPAEVLHKARQGS